jgi:hypothetical protein
MKEYLKSKELIEAYCKHNNLMSPGALDKIHRDTGKMEWQVWKEEEQGYSEWFEIDYVDLIVFAINFVSNTIKVQL